MSLERRKALPIIFQDRAPELANAVRTVAGRVEGISNDIRDQLGQSVDGHCDRVCRPKADGVLWLRHSSGIGYFEASRSSNR